MARKNWIVITYVGEPIRFKTKREVDEYAFNAEAYGCEVFAINNYGKPHISNKKALELFDQDLRRQEAEEDAKYYERTGKHNDPGKNYPEEGTHF
jgi:hypothetical protein